MRSCLLSASFHLLLTLAVLGPAPARAADAGAEAMAQIRRQVVAHYAAGAPSAGQVRGYVKPLRDDGSWPDVDYADKDRGGWSTAHHVYRVLGLAQAYAKPGHPLQGSPEVRDAVARALRHWVEEDYRNSNWWYGRIGVPNAVGPALLLMGNALPADLADRVRDQVLGRSRMGMTGQNRVWCAGIALVKGLLADDAALVRVARDAIFEEIRITTAEGIQPDLSFHQHGPQQQWGNYGLSFAGDTVEWGTMLRGTPLALEAERVAILRGYVLDGLSWVVWNGRMDISGCGRQIFRHAQRAKGGGVRARLQAIQRLDPDRADDYARRLRAVSTERGQAFVGHKHFWRSDIAVHRRPDWYASVKMSSTRVIGAETCNSENMQGLHLGDGALYVLRGGDEYADLFPVWNWRRLPGTTCCQDDGSLTPSSKRCRGSSSFVGGVTDGRRGLAAMVYRRGGLTARKAWAFLDDRIVCWGMLTCSENVPVVTTVNQCHLRGPVTLASEGAPKTIQKGREGLEGPTWVHHDGVGYVVHKGRRLALTAEVQAGNWHRVHHRYGKDEVSRDVFALAIDHGVRPKAIAYAYTVLPGASAEGTARAAAALGAEVVWQSPAVQAVAAENGRVILAAFFEAGRLAWGDGGSLSASAACLVLLDATGEKPRLFVADPTHRQQAVRVSVTLPKGMTKEGAGEADVQVALPTGPLAGSTVEVQPST